MGDGHQNLFSGGKRSAGLLPDILRPASLSAVVGQSHLTAPSAPLSLMLRQKTLRSMILWGPPGVGKTSLALLLAKESGLQVKTISAVFSGVADLKKIFEEAQTAQTMGLGTCLFVDEIHRFNRSQQDSFLPYVEKGLVILIGATTENPSFSLNDALLSRMAVYVLKSLSRDDFQTLLDRANDYYKEKLPLDAEGLSALIDLSSGDARYFLNMVEQLHLAKLPAPPNREVLQKLLQKRMALYDKQQDGHYNYISALHKSVRGSDPDAALYWLYRMLNAGEDRNFLARRIVRMAYEDVGLADTTAQGVALEAWQTMERLGSPEGEIALAMAVVYLALAPKSNSIYKAIAEAEDFAKKHNNQDPPKIILNPVTKMMKNLDYGKDYIYDHLDPDGFSGQEYFPADIASKRPTFYKPVLRGFERELQKRSDYFQQLRKQKRKKYDK